ncbi:hypothetical protein [Enterobacter sp. UCD-UG_FMILLET]|uniref:hypothetical protein n=1 Tax=Enterobacter sp. UCD-UG_FMILLET TaxID=1542468 RepID=UPI003FA45E96
MEVINRPMTILFLSQSSTIRVFYRRNTGCICRQNRLMKKFVHPSERYIAIPTWDSPGTMISKDYGRTWVPQFFSVGPNEPDGSNQPSYDDIISFTVVNDQGFLQTKHRLYMSSKPFDDPRTLPGGSGITYTASDGAIHHLKPNSSGPAWGLDYITKQGLKEDTVQFKTNYQDLPDKVPEVKGYTGWDHMRCDMDAGRKGY